MTADTFEEIATTFNVGRSLVQRVYNEYKAAVMNVIPGSPGGRTTAVFLMDYWEWDDSPQIQFPWLLKAILDDAERAAKRVQRKQKTSA